MSKIRPKEFGDRLFNQVRAAVNEEMAELETQLIDKSPVGIGGSLRLGWNFRPMRRGDGRTASITQSQNYFLAVELGRRPGKGISAEGQRSVELWAARKLGLSGNAAKGFAYRLSQKYKAQGRPAQGFAGLANEGDRPYNTPEEIKPVAGGLIAKSFKEIERRLNNLPPLK